MLEIQLHGKIALVTGATGQLGRVMVRTLADCGANVVICYHKNERQAMALKEEAEQKYGVRGLAAQVDLVQPDSVQQLHEQVLNVFGAPQILVHSAVSQIKNCNVLEQPLADYYNQFETIMIHNVNMVKTFAPAMMDQRYGRIIGINTECSMECRAGGSAYAASKRAMDGLYRSLAKELGPYNITVNQVAPGWTISDRERRAWRCRSGPKLYTKGSHETTGNGSGDRQRGGVFGFGSCGIYQWRVPAGLRRYCHASNIEISMHCMLFLPSKKQFNRFKKTKEILLT